MTSTNSFTSPSETALVLRYFMFRFKVSMKKCISDRYFKANIVYVIYSSLLLHIDLNIGRESASDTMYTLLGYVHILNGKSLFMTNYCDQLNYDGIKSTLCPYYILILLLFGLHVELIIIKMSSDSSHFILASSSLIKISFISPSLYLFIYLFIYLFFYFI